MSAAKEGAPKATPSKHKDVQQADDGAPKRAKVDAKTPTVRALGEW